LSFELRVLSFELGRKRIGEGKVESFELRVLSYGEKEREF